MTWNDIEVKWAAMARRVGSDRKEEEQAATKTSPDLARLQSEPTEQRATMRPDRSAP